MSKRTRIIISLLVCVLLSFTIASATVFAQWGEKQCPGINKCYGKCKSTKCQVGKVYKITVYFTYKKCKLISKRIKKCKRVSDVLDSITTASDIKELSIITKKGTRALKKPSYLDFVINGIIYYGKSVDKNYKVFRNAVDKKRGLELKYEYVIHKTYTSLSQYRKVSKKYK